MKQLITLILALLMQQSAAIEIVIDQGVDNPIALAIVPFSLDSEQGAIDISAIVANDLERSGRFKIMDEADIPQKPNRLKAVNFGDWRKLGMENLVIGRVDLSQSGDYEVTFRLIDVYLGRQIAGYRIPAKHYHLRRVAHQISDIIFKKLTGIAGAFDTRVAYVTVTGSGFNKEYALHIADADGYNPQVLLKSPEPLLSPDWSPDGKKIAYVSFEKKNSAIYVQEITTGKRERLVGFSGINSAPAWSPDGSQLALTLSKDGNTEIYILTVATKTFKRITNNPAIDTEPDWAPDGKKIVFTSNRGGAPQIYEVSANGGTPRRLALPGNYNTRARFAPDGKSISLVHAVSGQYKIAVFNFNSQQLEILTDSKLDESPSFAPNGSIIIYATTHNDKGQLAAVSVDGLVRGHSLALQKGDVREPAWGPFLK